VIAGAVQGRVCWFPADAFFFAVNWGLKFAKHKNQTRFYHQKSSNIMGHRQKNISRLSKNITQGGLTLCFAILHWPQWLSGLHAGNRLLSGVVLHEQLFVFLRIQTRFAGRKQCSMETTWTKIAKTHGSFKYGYFWWIFFAKIQHCQKVAYANYVTFLGIRAGHHGFFW
jgi:hypothetical protein